MRGLIRTLGVLLIGIGSIVLVAAPANACPSGSTSTSVNNQTVCVVVVDKGHPSPRPGPPHTTQGGGVQSVGSGPAAPPPPPWVVAAGATVCPGVFANGTCPTLPPAGPGAPAPVAPGVLATKALGQMQLTAPTVRMAPAPPLKTYTGLETWLWMPQGQWAPQRLSVSAGATTVTVTAAPSRVYWDMGPDGGTACYGPGRAWVHSYSQYEKTDCSFTFDHVSSYEPDGKFRVEATIVYQVDWTCTGTCLQPGGTLGEVNSAPGRSAIRVGERQSVVIG